MGRKGKTKAAAPAIAQVALDMSDCARRERLAELGLTPEAVQRQLDVTGPLEKTALCTEHAPSAERPLECAKCGRPLPNAPLCAVVTPEELARVLDAQDGAVVTPADRAWARKVLDLDEAAAEARQSEKRFEDADPVKLTERAADDGPDYERHSLAPLKLAGLWSMRLSILARESGESPRDYVEKLIRRQWVARGKGA